MTNKFASPIVTPDRRVLTEWVDYNGHMNVGYYTIAFDKALDDAYEEFGLGPPYTATGSSTFALESHITYAQEVLLDDPLRITFQLIDCDTKRIHYFMQMVHAEKGYLASTCEQISVHVDLEARKSSNFPSEIYADLETLKSQHSELPRPAELGRQIGIRRRG